MATPTPSAEDQAKLLEDALTVVKVQSFQMKRCLVRNLFSLLHSSHLISLFFTPFSNAPHTTERGAKKKKKNTEWSSWWPRCTCKQA
ncbi:hypothetical protein F5H01DRAFT_143286 [Linnemannia elongata]|nr:hypothetical protein F5H01DRAFT_143286 [Linnemannia elongata]